jgi:hypothetical protein
VGACKYNTQVLVDAGAALERSGAALSVMNVVLAGSLAFAFLDKGSSTWVNAAPPEWCVSGECFPPPSGA